MPRKWPYSPPNFAWGPSCLPKPPTPALLLWILYSSTRVPPIHLRQSSPGGHHWFLISMLTQEASRRSLSRSNAEYQGNPAKGDVFRAAVYIDDRSVETTVYKYKATTFSEFSCPRTTHPMQKRARNLQSTNVGQYSSSLCPAKWKNAIDKKRIKQHQAASDRLFV